jgi:multimeric flavodoxin WrbA
MGKNIVAIIGSYRKDGVTNSAVEAILAGAREKGARTNIIYLTEQHIEFCTNCRRCSQTPGSDRGICPQNDDLQSILKQIESADGLVLSSPVNCGNVTAIFRRFMERLMGFAYWPWGQPSPSTRRKSRNINAVLVSASAMPALVMPLFTGAARALKQTAAVLGARVIGTQWIGLAAQKPHYELSGSELVRARKLGYRLAGNQ